MSSPISVKASPSAVRAQVHRSDNKKPAELDETRKKPSAGGKASLPKVSREPKSAAARKVKENVDGGVPAKAHAQLLMGSLLPSAGLMGMSTAGPAIGHWLGTAGEGLFALQASNGKKHVGEESNEKQVAPDEAKAGLEAGEDGEPFWKKRDKALKEEIRREAHRRNIPKDKVPEALGINRSTFQKFGKHKPKFWTHYKIVKGFQELKELPPSPFNLDFARAETQKLMDDFDLDINDVTQTGSIARDRLRFYLNGGYLSRAMAEKVLKSVIQYKRQLPKDFRRQKEVRAEIRDTLKRYGRGRAYFVRLLDEKDEKEAQRFYGGGFVSPQLFKRIKMEKHNIGPIVTSDSGSVRKMMRKNLKTEAAFEKLSYKTGVSVPLLKDYMGGIELSEEVGGRIYEAMMRNKKAKANTGP